MGILRFLLALSVVINHSTPIFGLSLVGGRVAVESFFIISGFYMALILSEKYQSGWQGYQLFLRNRILRIYPIYWAVLAATLVILITVQFFLPGKFNLPWFGPHEPLGIWLIIYLVLAHIILFGQDILVFTGHTNFLLVPQGWALSLEMVFYLLAPFFVKRKTWVLLLLIVASFGLRLALWRAGFDYDPWTYRFFPAELAFFLAGVLTFRLYQIFNLYGLLFKKVSYLAFVAVIAATLFYQYIPGEYFKQWAYYVLLIVALPFVFELTRNSAVVRRIGDFSYPVYICHIFVLAIAKAAVMPVFHIAPQNLGLVTAVLTVAFSYLLLKFIGDPIDRFRHRPVPVP
ncbi:MAG: hypothetical protein A3C50_03550 [Candidatus Staskawiczbacteria bacterium RIFCSPHIGHO2_02_FULL_43_16]|uniref:Acyltransferase 3 domain-containing protein n=1 Tax=Candidatus Staskawiczbacteria bacterium RIFCSPHIGHO2_01_FULL_41_41 TaxID=1802203 RepID=A0A1G2HSL4_9BACT|nr:MAG: hypothetical protein A2822_02655 [Candidatus Staskawiczbacteria bacterium RIFCSPHIGHO2_01_FULL_41_41]OGZ68013.1 MAG: hypothetical protein A3C50_03550 [Candidatus Staskawiczbacteria bacterium RIFCSPHIGHO2_02_FULL_43_16]OGZ74578.1 MAG: hypothetical protein A3A12_02350 [Candidatus Staskawiczbacteria bacterium RIFCSPLOWO2_01_FULL_43_17b]